MKCLVLIAVFCTGCYSETIGPYVTEIVPSKDHTHYVVTRCMINLDHGLFGSVSPSKGDCQTDKIVPLAPPSGSAASTVTSAAPVKATPK